MLTNCFSCSEEYGEVFGDKFEAYFSWLGVSLAVTLTFHAETRIRSLKIRPRIISREFYSKAFLNPPHL